MGIFSVEVFEEIERLKPDLRKVFIRILKTIESNLDEVVKRADFAELNRIVEKLGVKVSELAEAQRITQQQLGELAEAQKRTEERVDELAGVQKKTEERLNELIDAQKRTEEKVNELIEVQKKTEERLSELADAQKKTEERLNSLAEAQKKTEEKVNELIDVQKKTEERLNELAEAQKRTEEKVNALAEAQKKTEERLNELAEAQKRTEEKVNALAEAQKKTEEKVNALADAQKKTEEEVRKLAVGLGNLRSEVGGLSRTLSYAFENEAFRKLPELLSKKYGIEIVEKFVRTEIQGEEINFLGKGKRDGKEVYIVGEAKLRLDETRKDFEKVFKELERKVQSVRNEYGDVETVKMIVTHFAKKNAIKLAEERDIIVVQSFEW